MAAIHGPPPREPARRRARAAERRQAILEAALSVFSEQGFAAARMEDVARRAGVAKGTIYLHFADKQDLFAGLIRQAIVPVLAEILSDSQGEVSPVRDRLKQIGARFATALRTSPRQAVIRLLIAEGPRFPALADLYYREVVQPGITHITALARLARERGEIAGDALERFPQLAMAAVLLSVIWDGLFARFEPLDAQAMIAAQFDLLLRPPDA